MNLTEKYASYSTISADVINKDISNYGSNLVLNVGTNDGVKKGMTVIADQGLVRICNRSKQNYVKSKSNNRPSKHSKL